MRLSDFVKIIEAIQNPVGSLAPRPTAEQTWDLISNSHPAIAAWNATSNLGSASSPITMKGDPLDPDFGWDSGPIESRFNQDPLEVFGNRYYSDANRLPLPGSDMTTYPVTGHPIPRSVLTGVPSELAQLNPVHPAVAARRALLAAAGLPPARDTGGTQFPVTQDALTASASESPSPLPSGIANLIPELRKRAALMKAQGMGSNPITDTLGTEILRNNPDKQRATDLLNIALGLNAGPDVFARQSQYDRAHSL